MPRQIADFPSDVALLVRVNGTQLVEFAEQQIFRESPNVFLCVSAFNARARQFYARLGYESIGELKDYVVAGQSEILMRKTIGPRNGYQPQA